MLRWTTLVFALLLVEGAARLELVRPATLVPATTMALRLGEILRTGTIPSSYFARTGTPTLGAHLVVTAESIVLSFALAVAVGTLAGVLLWRLPILARILNPYLIAYYAVPIFALYPLFILLFGVGLVPIVLIAFLFALVVVVVNTAMGFRRVDAEIYPKVGRSLRLRRGQPYLWIYLPAAAPYLFTGWKLAFIYSTIGVIASEFIISTRGLGHVIERSYRNFDTANMYAGILLVVGITLLVNTILSRVERTLYGRFER